jgi:DNA-binding transcriptional MerR regulator
LDKAPDAFRTISEVADEIDVPQHVLRFWESRFPQIRPMKRGGGRRYYRPDDVDLLRGVRHLLYGEGYTIRGVQRILREQGGAFVQSVWRADAEPLPPELEEDRAGDDVAESAGAERLEPNLFGLRPGAQGVPDADQLPDTRTEAAPGIESPTRRMAALDNRRKLQAALDELVTCRTIIDAAFRQD